MGNRKWRVTTKNAINEMMMTTKKVLHDPNT